MAARHNLNLLDGMICDILRDRTRMYFEEIHAELLIRQQFWPSIMQPCSKSSLFRKIHSLSELKYIAVEKVRTSHKIAIKNEYRLTNFGESLLEKLQQVFSPRWSLDVTPPKGKKPSQVSKYEISYDEIGEWEDEGGALLQDFAFPDSLHISEKQQQGIKKVASEFISMILTDLDIKVQIPQEIQRENIINHSSQNPASVEGELI